ncbi:SRPBCC family protein [Sphaerisporangium corydalis]|uniref:SRPBCC domain-containing protein n=1 Tax=Sphaerisporangium corydalis TaxID=1441875 RepID=A0ABV9EL55_9ACTN|nr:SRPBCC domain-containing protein [Sphaerisporangium corydalis]
MPHEFELRKQVTLKATPEQVWEAIATGPGIDSWFMGRNEIEPRQGGATRQYFGDVPVEATVSAWEPARRFAFRSDPAQDGSFMAFEYLIEARGQGTTVLRMVQSGILGDDWEAEYDGLSRGWDMYLHTLGQYLTHFQGRHAVVVFALRPGEAGHGPAWAALERGLGLTGPVARGERVRLTPDGFGPIQGVADYVLPDFLGVRTGDGLYRFIRGTHDTLVVGHHLFADIDAKRAEQDWQDWLDALDV